MGDEDFDPTTAAAAVPFTIIGVVEEVSTPVGPSLLGLGLSFTSEPEEGAEEGEGEEECTSSISTSAESDSDGDSGTRGAAAISAICRLRTVAIFFSF